MIYNKSGHPVEVKKISVRIWSLRDEIEAAIGRRIKECEAAGIPLFIDDIKEFYKLNMKAPLTQQSNVIQLAKAEQEGVNSLMESLGEEAAPDALEVAPENPEGPSAENNAGTTDNVASEVDQAAVAAESKTFAEAENIMAIQSSQGLDTNRPNPILQRPYQRQAPDLDKISYGFTLLSDIQMGHILSFVKNNFVTGQSVVVEFLIPQNFMMTAEVSYCHHYAMRSRIISSTKPDYRLQCKFSYGMAGERQNLRNFLKSIEPVLPKANKKPKKESEEDSLGL